MCRRFKSFTRIMCRKIKALFTVWWTFIAFYGGRL
jgi:hypothetical protein